MRQGLGNQLHESGLCYNNFTATCLMQCIRVSTLTTEESVLCVSVSVCVCLRKCPCKTERSSVIAMQSTNIRNVRASCSRGLVVPFYTA